MKGNVIQMNTLHLNSVRLNGIGKVQSVSLKGGSTEDPVFPPVEPPIEPEPTPTYTLSASVTNGKVTATLNGSAVNLPYTANEGDVIVVEVTPNDGYTFEGWNDGNTDNPRSITMTADVVLSAQCVEVVVPPVGKYIQFADAEVERVLMANGVSSDGVGITMEDAASVTSIGSWFMSNKTITSFEEFEHFTGVSQLAMNAFNGCVNLKKLTLPKSCVSIQQQSLIDTGLEKINLENVTYIGRYAIARTNISEISAPNAETIEVGYLFKCPNLKEVNAEDFGNIAILDGGTGNFPTSTLYECASLEKVVFPKTLTKLSGWMLGECRNLKYVEIPDVVTFDCPYFAFVAAGATGMSHLDVVIRATTPFAIDNTFLMRRTDFTIYVPDASLEAYKTAVNWSAYADRIHPLSEIEGSLVFYDKLVGDGTAYINTEYMPKGTDAFAWDAAPGPNANRFIWGMRASNISLGALYYGSGQSYYLAGAATSYDVKEDNSTRFSRTMLVRDDGEVYSSILVSENGETILATSSKDKGYATKTSDKPIYIFAAQKSTADISPDRRYTGAIYSFVITDIDGNTIMSLKPCTWNGEAGMWDEVGNKFYGNAATRGEFSVAND